MAVPMTVVWFANNPERVVSEVNDIGITSFTGTYEAHAVDGRLELAVTEVIVADFRNWNTNHGLERRLDAVYGSTPIGISDISASADGGSSPWTMSTQGDEVVIRIGNPNRYVNGRHTYTISYTISNAMVEYPDGHQEIYLDINGTGWQQSIGTVSAQITVPASLSGRLDGSSACYVGTVGSTTRCPLGHAGSTFFASRGSVTARSTLTIAIGFLPHTVATAVPVPDNRGRDVAAIAAPWAVPVLAWIPPLFVVWLRRRRLNDATAPIQYVAPAEAPILVADFLDVGRRGVAAQLADLVVKKQAVVTTTEELMGTSPQRRRLGLRQAAALRRSLRVQLVDPAAIEDKALRQLCQALFGTGDPRELRIADEVHADAARLARTTLAYRASLRGPRGISGAVLAVGMSALLLVGWAVVWLDATSPWFLLSGAVAVIGVVAAAHYCPDGGRLTDRGKQLMTHLAGLRRFVLMAEADRIAYLQNAVDAPRRRAVSAGADMLDPDTHVVSLLEPLLPYAIIFGAESTWSSLVGSLPDSSQTPVVDLTLVGAQTWETLWRVAEIEERSWTRSVSGRSEPTWWTSRPSIGQGSFANFAHEAGSAFTQAMDDWAQSRDDDRGSGGGGWFSSSGSSSSSSSYSGSSSSSSSYGSSGGGSAGGGMGGGGGGGW